MKKLFFSLFVLLLTGFKAQPPDGDPSWQLVFSDDFNNLSNWRVSHYSDGGNNGSISLQQNATIVSNNLVLKANYGFTPCDPAYINNPTNNPTNITPWYGCNSSAYNFNHGYIVSNSNNFGYGYYEIRAKIDYVKGHWPAFVLYNGSGTNVYCEIDVFEMVAGEYGTVQWNNTTNSGSYSNNRMNEYDIGTNVHGYGVPNPANINGGNEFPQLNYVNDYTQWHTYGFEYWDGRMVWYVDGQIVRRIYGNLPGYDDTQPMIVTLGTSFRSSVYGNASINAPVSSQANFEVDYFNYYQLNTTCSPAVIANCSYNFSTHTDYAKQYYEIGTIGSNFCYDYVPNDKLYVFKANDYVELKGEFAVPLGSQAIFDADHYCAKPSSVANGCGLTINACNYSFFGYDNLPKQYIEFAGPSSCNTIVQPTDNVHLQAKEYIRLREGFSVPLNSEIEIKILNCN